MACRSRCRSASTTRAKPRRLRSRRRAPPSHHRLPRGAGVAAAAGPRLVLLVAEVAQEVQHAAAVRLGEAQHLVELLLLVLALPHVGGTPARAPHPGRVSLHHRPAVGPELVESALHLLGVEAGAPDELGDRARLGRESAEEPLEDLRLGVVALEEVLVRAAVGPGVEEDGARGLPVAPGAADLLVVALDRRRHRGVDDGAHVGLVDAHAEGDRGDDRRRARRRGRRSGRARAAARPCPRGRRRPCARPPRARSPAPRLPCAWARTRWPGRRSGSRRSADGEVDALAGRPSPSRPRSRCSCGGSRG